MVDRYVGVDVSKHSLEVVVRADGRVERSYRVANTATDCRTFAKELSRSSMKAVVFEATGGYERTLRSALGQAGVPATMLNPRQARAFAEYKGKLSKTDKVDANTLALLAEEGRPTPTPPPDPESETLKALVTRRLQVVDMLTMEKNRCDLAPAVVEPMIKRNIKSLERGRVRLDCLIQQAVQQDTVLRERDRLLQSIKGIGPATSLTILALLPEAGFLPAKKLAALVGVAPYAADSGTLHGKRFIRGGRGAVRHALYMAALTGSRCNPQLRAFYQRLLSSGKPKKLALVAVMNKLLAIANAVLRRGLAWDPAWIHQLHVSPQTNPTGWEKRWGVWGRAPGCRCSTMPRHTHFLWLRELDMATQLLRHASWGRAGA